MLKLYPQYYACRQAMPALCFFAGWMLLSLSSCKQQGYTKEELAEQRIAADQYLKPAFELFGNNRLRDAIRICDSLYYAHPQPTVMMDLLRNQCKGIVYQKISINDTLIAYRDSALQVIEKNDLKYVLAETYAEILLLKAEHLFQLHKPEKGNELFYTAQQFAEANNLDVQYYVAEQIGFVAYRQKDYRQSMINFKKALELHLKNHPEIYIKSAELTNNVALSYYKLNIEDSTMLFYQKALQILPPVDTTEGIKRSRGVLLGNLANLYKNNSLLDTAIALSKQSIALNAVGCCEQRDAQLVQMRLIDMYYAKKQYNEMQAELLSLRSGLDSLPQALVEVNWQRQMADYYEAMNGPARAFAYHKKFAALQDSLNLLTQKDVENNIIKDQQIKTQQADVVLLKKDNQLSQIYLLVVVVLALMASAIGMLVYKNFRRSRKNVQVLTSLNEQIGQQKTDLEKANKEKDRILHVVAHDLRNPVGAIGSFAEILQVKYKHEPEEEKVLQMIQGSAHNSLELINELLEINNIKADDEQALSKVDVGSLVDEAIQQVHFKADKKQQAIKTSIEASVIKVDEPKMKRVLVNLLDNAIKFSHAASDINIRSIKENGHIILSVTDSGIGIPAHLHQQVFQPLAEVKRKGTAGERSNGLGLSICKQIVENNGGRIWMESEENKGSSFFIQLPSTS